MIALCNRPTKIVMRMAQTLYEGVEVGGVEVGGGERRGLITYMRTDGLEMSDDAVQAVRAFIDKDKKAKLPVHAVNLQRTVEFAGGVAQLHGAISFTCRIPV